MPDEPVSQQLWQLMHRDFSMRLLVATVELLGEVPWATLTAEQQHSSLALLHRWPSEYGPKTLIARSLMLQVMKLLPGRTKGEKEKEGILRRMDNAMRAQPSKTTGMDTVVKAMVEINKGRKEDGRPGYDASMKRLAQKCFTRQAAMWAGMSIRQQMDWSHRARLHAAERQVELSGLWKKLHQELAVVENKLDVKRRTGTPLTMSSAALTDRDLACFASLWATDAFRERTTLQTQSMTIGTAPTPTPELPGPDPCTYKDPEMPEWASPLVRHRALLQGTALQILRPCGESEYWKLVFMVKSPKQFLAMSRLVPAEEHLACTALDEPRDSLYSFNCNFADCSSAADVAVGPADRLFILFRLNHNGGTHLSSDMHPIGLGSLLAGQDQDYSKAEDEAKRVRKAAKKHDEFVLAMPWLQHLDRQIGFSSGVQDALSMASEQAAKASSDSSAPMLEVDDEAMLDALARLEKERIAAAIEQASSGCPDFASRVRGGESQVLKTGEGTHAHQAQCTSKFASAWARRRGLQVTFKAHHLHHGISEAKLLCRSWCHRMQFL